jgi:F-type H+-transporting ATPase subunit a
MADPIHQFQIVNLFTVAKLGSTEIAFTNSAAFMLATVALVAGFLVVTTGERALVPNRLQSLSEMTYEFVAGMLRDSAGEAGMKFFPFVFSLFIFVLIANLFGMIPFAFTVTSHIIVTFALAMLVFLTVTIYGFVRHGTHFLRVFVPSGVPMYVLPLVVLIELISFLSRPISHSVRLFANMLAGHITLKVFAGFVGSLLGAGALLAPIAVLPLAMVVALTALEFLIAFLQAYVFAILTCIYLNDALHPGH